MKITLPFSYYYDGPFRFSYRINVLKNKEKERGEKKREELNPIKLADSLIPLMDGDIQPVKRKTRKSHQQYFN